MPKRNDDGEAALEFYDKRRRWLDYVNELDGLSDRAFRVGFWVAKKMNGNDQCSWYRHDQIARALCMSVDKVARALLELETKGVLIIVRQHRQVNRYLIRLPFEADDP
jgi:hypothetical protein